MEHYVTLFDSFFLPQALALHTSMERHCAPYRLWMLCVDEASFSLLQRLDLPNSTVISLEGIETASLKEVKPGRTRGEYCWTLTPFAPRFVFEADPGVDRVTYIDADLWFRKNPRPIFEEFEKSGAHVLMTDHGYAPEYDQSETSGQYCVQFMTFNRLGGEHVRQWWEDRCIEWCFARFEDGKFGDQKYLDDWPDRFGNDVHVLRHETWTQAPWNATRFPYSQSILFHFHGLRLAPRGRLDFGSIYPLPPIVVRQVYGPYVADIKAVIDRLRSAGFEPAPQVGSPAPWTIARRFLSGIYNNLWRFSHLHYQKY